MSRVRRALVAADGLRARDNGAWGRDKLAFLEHFGPIALLATQKKPQRVYVDLFAGPGKNVQRGGRGTEFDGSPLRVLRMSAPGRADLSFTDAVFVNWDRRDHEALSERVERFIKGGSSRIASDRIRCVLGDSNELLPSLMEAIPTWAYVFVFADIEAPKQWPWTSVQELRRRGHRSVDFYALFPLEMAICRLISYSQTQTERYAAGLTRFFGTEAWRDIAAARRTSAESAQLRRDLEDLYLSQLRSEGPPAMWRYAGSVKDVRRAGGHYLYRMLFASNHQAADRIARWARTQSAEPVQQGELF